MMRRCRWFLAAVAISLIGAPAAAAAQSGDTLSLDTARDRAIAGSPAIAAAQASAAAAVARARQALLLAAPELDLSVGAEGPFTRPQAAATYTLPIRSSAKTHALRAVFDAETRRADRDVAAVRARVELAVIQDYYRAALLDDRLRLDREDSAAVAELADNARQRRASGMATDLDVLRLESEAGAAARRAIADAAAGRAARLALASLVGLTENGMPPLSIDPAAARRDTSALVLKRALVEADVATAELVLARAQATQRVATLYRWSDPRLGGSYGYEQGEQQLAAVIRVPLPARHGNANAIREAELEVSAGAARLAEARRRAALVMAEAANDRAAAAAQLDLLTEDLGRRRTAEALARRRLDEGGPYLQIWLDIRRDRLLLEREQLDLLTTLATAGPVAEASAATWPNAADEPSPGEGEQP